MSKFIGRGENRVKQILERLYPEFQILTQVPLQNLVLDEDYVDLDIIYKQHKFDLVIQNVRMRFIAAVEVNYKHGNTASRKWTNIFSPRLKKAGVLPVAINDYECKSLFDTKEERLLRWEDFEDVITALRMGGAKP